jgi:gamma-glutamyltranspeptidase / glutathione hydrolase
MSVKRNSFILVFSLLILFSQGCKAPSAPILVFVNGRGISARQGMVVTAHPLASEVGATILQNGGNAFDAAIAVQFALAVVYPGAGNIAGGGFAVYRKTNDEAGCLDFREKAPLAAEVDMYLDEDGEVISGLSSFGALSVGVPGTVDGMIQLHQKLGSLPFQDLVQPAIDLARNGFVLTELEANKLNRFQDAILQANDSASYFFNPQKWQTGDPIVLPQLARTLELIRDRGRAGFYSGPVAGYLIEEMASGNGVISQTDLDAYKAVWRDPIQGSYKQYRIISMPPPSSGGIALLQLLKGSETYNFKNFGHNSLRSIHLMTELERRVYADRAIYLCDPDYQKVPVAMLLNSSYLNKRFSDIRMHEKTDSREIKEGSVGAIESIETTHFSIVDKDRNAIAVTTTLNGNFGSKVFVEKGGFFLNNEMDDFSVKPGAPNQYGLVGGKANAIAPGKRMLSSMTPTIVEKEGQLFMVVGSPGGSTIITSVYQTILNVVEYHMDMQQAIEAKKTHHQWMPDRILYEQGGLNATLLSGLEQLGHFLEARNPIGQVNAVLVLPDGRLQGGADPRADNVAWGLE